MSNHPLLEVRGLQKYFPLRKPMFSRKDPGAVKAVDGVSFSVERGETLGLIGESGCGKSTVCRLLMGLYEPTAGEILYDGQRIQDMDRKAYCRKVQMIFQDPYSSLDARMSVGRIIQEPLRIHEHMTAAERRAACLPILEQVGLLESDLEKYPPEFSGGQRQRIGIARALVTKPDVLLCDEPVSALDVSIQSSILNLFKDMQRNLGLTYIFISHDMSVVRHVSDRIAVMYLGHIVEMADKKTFFTNAKHPYSVALMSAIPVPDPFHKKERILLAGDPPSPISPPSGCPFRTRCRYATEQCAQAMPELQEIEAGHFVACHLCSGKESST